MANNVHGRGVPVAAASALRLLARVCLASTPQPSGLA